MSNDAVEFWATLRRKTRGSQTRYSDLAIEICLSLWVVFRLPLRQSQSFMRSTAKQMVCKHVISTCKLLKLNPPYN
ncbi:MAG: transposase [Sedimentitalea sp.]|uniref:transposase n=1 Tax=Sedimentitalea sp. TaxID=2048915 RepID=UPI0032630218